MRSGSIRFSLIYLTKKSNGVEIKSESDLDQIHSFYIHANCGITSKEKKRVAIITIAKKASGKQKEKLIKTRNSKKKKKLNQQFAGKNK